VIASLFSGQSELSPYERKIFVLIKSDTAIQFDEIGERLDLELFSSEIFSALFEKELSGRTKQMPGKNFVRTFSVRVARC
jgi:Predicted Rossmann fold nucleotide-binding protein involved in DNA uptake